MVVTAHSSAKEKRTVSVRVRVYAISYTGVASKEVKTSKHQLEIKSGENFTSTIASHQELLSMKLATIAKSVSIHNEFQIYSPPRW